MYLCSWQAGGLLVQGTAWGENWPCWKKKGRVWAGGSSALAKHTTARAQGWDIKEEEGTGSPLVTSPIPSDHEPHCSSPLDLYSGHQAGAPQVSSQPHASPCTGLGCIFQFLATRMKRTRSRAQGLNSGLTEQLTPHYLARARLLSL